MANEDYLITSSHTVDTNATNASVSSNYIYTGNHVILDKWYIGEKAKDKLKNDLFSTLDEHEYKVKIEHANIVIDGVDRKGYHLIIINNGYTWYPTPTWYSTSTSQRMEITC